MTTSPDDPLEEHRGELVVVTGMTGAGRSTAAKELEDLGYYVIDNLPPSLLRDVVRLVDETKGTQQPIAVVVDVRSGSFFESLEGTLAQGRTGRRTAMLFLEADDDVPGLGEVRRKALLKRFGSLRKIRAATVDDIAEVPGIGRRTADAIVAALAEHGARPTVSINTATGEIEE